MTQGSCPPFPLVFLPFFLRRGLPPSKFSTPSHFPPLPPSPSRLQACLLSVPAPNAKFPRSAPDHFTPHYHLSHHRPLHLPTILLSHHRPLHLPITFLSHHQSRILPIYFLRLPPYFSNLAPFLKRLGS